MAKKWIVTAVDTVATFTVSWTGEDGQHLRQSFASRREAEQLWRKLKAERFGPEMSELVVADDGNRTSRRIVPENEV